MDNLNNLKLNTSPLSSSRLNVGIIGFGAMGCLLSSQMHSLVNIYALPSNPKLNNVHFQLDTGSQSNQFSFPVWQNEFLDVVIICCKATQSLSALDLWQHAISKQSQIVLFQNGMGQHELASTRFPNNSIFAASTTEGAFKKSPQHIVHAGQGITQWGRYSGPIALSNQTLVFDMSQLKGQHHWSADISSVLLAKLAINAVINPLTVKYNCLNGELINNPAIKVELKRLCSETEDFYKAMQWHLNFNITERIIAVAESTASNISSMLQDVRAQRETEIDYINGYLLSNAKFINYQLPEHQNLFTYIKSI
jgi:2-dehydropantoate 2-reductase